MIHDGDKEAINLLKVPLKNNVQAFDTKVGRSVIGSHWQTDNILESLYKMQVEKSGKLKYLLQVYARENDIRRQERPLLQIQVNGAKTSRAENQGSSFQSEKSRRGQTCTWSSEQRKSERKKAKTLRKTNPSEETGYVGSRMANVHWEICGVFKHDPTKRNRGDGRLLSPSPTGTPHRNLKGDGNGGDYGGARCTIIYW